MASNLLDADSVRPTEFEPLCDKKLTKNVSRCAAANFKSTEQFSEIWKSFTVFVLHVHKYKQLKFLEVRSGNMERLVGNGDFYKALHNVG